MDTSIEQIDRNFNLHASKIVEQTPGMAVHRSKSLIYVDSGLSCDTFNILHIINGKDITREELNNAVNHFEKNELEYCIWVNSENLTPEVKQHLSDLSKSQQNEEVGMILDLNAFEPIRKEEHEHIKIVSNKQLLSDYANVIAENWTPPDQNVLRYYKATTENYLEKNNRIILLNYYHKNKPVSTVEMFPTDNNIIGLYGFATLEAFRGLGIGSTLMTYALNLAKSQRYRKVILQASEDGIGIYRRYGFSEKTIYYEFA